MVTLTNISEGLLLEQDSKMEDLKRAIIDRKPISIQYTGPTGEVESGPRYDIEPIILGTHSKTGNLVIWAYVFRGVSKTGLPGWKMFRVDRIQSIDPSGFEKDSFKLTDLPGYQQGKAPNAMKSMDQVYVYSPYWFEGYKRYEKKPYQPAPPAPEAPTPPEGEDQTVIQPDLTQHRLDTLVFNDLKQKVQNINGQQVISQDDYQFALTDLYNKKEGEWKNYQRLVSGNVRPGEGTRQRFQMASKNELDNLLASNNIVVSNNQMNPEEPEPPNQPEVPENNDNELMEIQKRIKELIFS